MAPHQSARSRIREVLGEVGKSLKALFQSEVDLARAEIKDVAGGLGRQSFRVVVLGVLMLVGVLPFLAFLVIGLGQLLDGRYWLSSLLVALICSGVSGVLVFKIFRQIRQRDLSLPRTRQSLQKGAEIFSHKLHDVNDAVRRAQKGDI